MLARMDMHRNHFAQFGYDGVELDFETPRVWAALVVRPSKEQNAADWLKEACLFAYWPNYVRQVHVGSGVRNGRGSRRARLSPVIPGYLFIAVRDGSVADPWGVVRQTPGVVGYLRDGSGKPAPLYDVDIEIIRNIEGGLNLPPPAKQEHRYKTGDKVRFTDDLIGRWPAGRVTALADDGRISIEVSLLRRTVPVWAYAHQIEAM